MVDVTRLSTVLHVHKNLDTPQRLKVTVMKLAFLSMSQPSQHTYEASLPLPHL